MWGETYQHYCVVTGKDQEHISEAHTLYAYAIMSVHVVEEDDSSLPQALLLPLLLFQDLPQLPQVKAHDDSLPRESDGSE